jgi:hypothetical protein
MMVVTNTDKPKSLLNNRIDNTRYYTTESITVVESYIAQAIVV